MTSRVRCLTGTCYECYDCYDYKEEKRENQRLYGVDEDVCRRV